MGRAGCPWFQVRMAYIGEHVPQLSGNELLEATRITRGLVGKDIMDAVRDYRESRRLPTRPASSTGIRSTASTPSGSSTPTGSCASSGTRPHSGASSRVLFPGDREPSPAMGEGRSSPSLHRVASAFGLRLAHHEAAGKKPVLTPSAGVS